MYSRDTGRGNSREGGRECTVGTRVGATVGRGGGGDPTLARLLCAPPCRAGTPRAPARCSPVVLTACVRVSRRVPSIRSLILAFAHSPTHSFTHSLIHSTCVSRSTNLEFGAAEHFLVVRTVDGRILHASEACGGVPPLPEQLTPNCQLWCQLWFRVVGLDCSVWRSAKHRAAAAAPAPPTLVLSGHAASLPPY